MHMCDESTSELSLKSPSLRPSTQSLNRPP
jgi:hypothetical protein